MHGTTYEYLKPTDEQVAKMARVRAAAAEYSRVIEAEIPDGPDKTYLIRKHREVADVGEYRDHAATRRFAANLRTQDVGLCV